MKIVFQLALIAFILFFLVWNIVGLVKSIKERKNFKRNSSVKTDENTKTEVK